MSNTNMVLVTLEVELREDEDPEKPGVGESVVGSDSIHGLRTISERYASYYMTQAVKCYAFIESRL